ncbi:MAG: FAD-dependent oxidoreductase, partial [Alphaproteobacteria bacterium]
MAPALGARARGSGVHRRAARRGECGQVIVVVGGGVTGLSTAFWLAREGHAVTVVEKGIVGWEASGRNG